MGLHLALVAALASFHLLGAVVSDALLAAASSAEGGTSFLFRAAAVYAGAACIIKIRK